MKILIDNSNLYAGGGIQVALSFLHDLINLGVEHTFFVVQSYRIAPLVKEENFPKNFVFFHIDNLSIFKKRKCVENIENSIFPDVIFCVFGPSYHRSKVPKIVGFAIPHLIYSDSPFFKKMNRIDFFKTMALSKIKEMAFRRFSDALIFETEDAKNIFNKKHTNQDLFVVGNTLNEIFFHKQKWKKCNINKNGKYKILCLTANYPHKNLTIIPEIIRILQNQYSWNDFEFVLSVNKDELGFDEDVNNNIEYLGQVPLESIPELYQIVDVVFIPTLLEVFSTTYLEAMFMRKPIIASDMRFARDVCEEGAYYCAPLSADSYASALVRLKEDNALYTKLVEYGEINLQRFGSSQDRTNKYLSVIEYIYNKYNK